MSHIEQYARLQPMYPQHLTFKSHYCLSFQISHPIRSGKAERNINSLASGAMYDFWPAMFRVVNSHAPCIEYLPTFGLNLWSMYRQTFRTWIISKRTEWILFERHPTCQQKHGWCPFFIGSAVRLFFLLPASPISPNQHTSHTETKSPYEDELIS